MTIVSFLQQQLDEVSLQISQLSSKRAKLFAELCFQKELALLQRNNLNKQDDQV